MKTITTRGRTVDIPTHVEELTPKQYEYYCFLAFALAGKVITPDYFRVRWFSFLIGLGKADFTILKEEHIDELEAQISAIEGYFVKEIIEGSERVHLNFDTVVNLLPEYKGYKGPGDLFQGVTFGEFVECYTVVECLDGAVPEAIAEGYEHIARTLYHIPDTAPVPDLLTFHAPKLFSSVWKAIQSGPIEINGKKIDFRIIFKSTGNTKPNDKTGWTGITFEVATAGLFGNVSQVEKADMWAVLIYLYKCKFEYLNEKRNTPAK